MYPEMLVAPMRAELTEVGFIELKNAEAVKEELNDKNGTKLLVFNSVCGCAAGTARPGIRLATQLSTHLPSKLLTVFAGMEKDAVETAREYTLPYPPSSPAIALFKNGELVHFIERHQIEGRSAEMIANNLVSAFETYCN